jgi:hypothetical protein
MISVGFFKPASDLCVTVSLRHSNSPKSLLSHRKTGGIIQRNWNRLDLENDLFNKIERKKIQSVFAL